MNLRQVRKKTKSVSNVKKITRSMQLVSAIKMKKSQTLAIEAVPYQQNLEEMIRKIMMKSDPKYSPLFLPSQDASPRELVVLVTSNKGLCGSFNFDILRYMSKQIDISNTDFVTIGKKAVAFVLKIGATLKADFSAPNPLTQASPVFTYCINAFLQGEYSKVSILFNRFVSTLHTEPEQSVLFPMSQTFKSKLEEKEIQEYLIEPAPDRIIDTLLRNYVEEKIRNAFIQSEAGEHSARMVAMKNATDNANDVIYNLTLLGNRLRQEKITSELLDMVTAKESVEQSN